MELELLTDNFNKMSLENNSESDKMEIETESDKMSLDSESGNDDNKIDVNLSINTNITTKVTSTITINNDNNIDVIPPESKSINLQIPISILYKNPKIRFRSK